MKKHWWKILGALLVLYALIAGLLIPLKPGILEISPESVKTGNAISMEISAYNSHFQEAEDIKVWLKLDTLHFLEGKNIKASSNTNLTVDFKIPNPKIPASTESAEMTLILDNEIDGYSLLPGAVQITNSPNGDSIILDSSTWISSLGNLHAKQGLTFPYRNILYETIRNLFYHVPLWFAMLIIFYAASINSARYLFEPTAVHKKKFMYGMIISLLLLFIPFLILPKSMAAVNGALKAILYMSFFGSMTGWFINKSPVVNKTQEDFKALSLTQVGILYGVLGLVTGAIWAKWTWGAWWSFDVKQNMSAIAILIYMAYLVLRSSFEDNEKEARISAVYNIFAFTTLIPLLFVIPRLYNSLHPGNGGNPGFGGEDLDNTMRMVFYPAIIGFTLVGVWLADLVYRYLNLKEKYLDRHEN